MAITDPTLLEKGSVDLLVMAVLDRSSGDGHEVARTIEAESGGRLVFQAALLYPLLYKLERRGLIVGALAATLVEPRRRLYRLTPAGRRLLRDRRMVWRDFLEALDRVATDSGP